MDAALRQAAAELQRNFPVGVTLEQVVYYPPAAFDPVLVDAIRHGAERAGCDCLDIVSGAGHDAVYVARTAPTAMIFVPCKDGISHNEVEDADPAHLEAGAKVLLHAMLERAGTASCESGHPAPR